MNINYYPILRWKKGEQEALKNLNDIQNNFYPIIELNDDCSPVEFFSTLAICCNTPIYFDVSRLDDDANDYLYDFISYAQNQNIQAYPVLYISDISPNIFDFIQDNVAIRIPIPVDFEGPSFEEILEILSPYSDVNINLILDAGIVLDSRAANSAFDSYIKILSDNLDILSKYSITLCITSFPEQLDINAGEDRIYKRYDILIFEKILNKFKNTALINNIHYSDYGVTKFTETEIDFSKIRYSPLPKVKYTTPTQYIVKKGEKNRLHNVFTRSYIDISREIVNSPYYFGENFSYGDNCIYKKATLPDATPGNSMQWVTYCTNHHLSVLMEQLSNLNVF